MRVLRLFFAVAVYLLPCTLVAACAGKGPSLSLSVERADPLPFEGPCPITVVVTNVGTEAVPIATLSDLQLFWVTFEEPSGWKLREEPGFTGGFEEPETEPLGPGESIRRTLYLHRVFSHLTPGRATLALRVTLCTKPVRPLTEVEAARPFAEADERQGRVALTGRFQVNLVERGPRQLARHIAAISARIDTAASAGERLSLYESVADLSHPDLVPLLLRALLDDSVHSFHIEAKLRLVDLCETYGMRQVLVDYLATRGVRQDQVIFDTWKEAGVRPSEEQLSELRRARNPWVRVSCLEYYGGTPGDRSSLEAEVADMSAEVRALQRGSGGAEAATPAPRGTTFPARQGTADSEAGDPPPGFPASVLAWAAFGGLLAGVAVGFLVLRATRRWR